VKNFAQQWNNGDMILRHRLTVVIIILSAASFFFTAAGATEASTAEATVNSITAAGLGSRLGTVTFADTAQGLQITPKLSGLPSGQHGFHIHDKGGCAPGMSQGKMAAGFAAGGHYDPANTRKHMGPWSTAGHRGDLPVLVVDEHGNATEPVTAPHLTVDQIRGRSIMIHAGRDNYSDSPLPLGGGGARIACGIIE
jgi:Cu-Zn family superoxide dismutase